MKVTAGADRYCSGDVSTGVCAVCGALTRYVRHLRGTPHVFDARPDGSRWCGTCGRNRRHPYHQVPVTQ